MTDQENTGLPAAVRDAIDRALSALVTPPEDDKPAGPPAPRRTEVTEQTARIRVSFDTLTKWIIGVFAAIGALIFGSIPFADLERVDTWSIGWGLGLAGVGILSVIFAATFAWEPVSVSLRRLAARIGDLKRVLTDDGASTEGHTVLRHPRLLRPSRRAALRLWESVYADRKSDADEPLEPADLLAKIHRLEEKLVKAGSPGSDIRESREGDAQVSTTELFAATSDGDGGQRVFDALDPHAREVLTERVRRLLERPASRPVVVWEAAAARIAQELARVKSGLSDIDGMVGTGDEQRRRALARIARAEVAHLEAVTSLRPSVAELSAAAESRATKDELDLQLDRRRSLLSQAIAIDLSMRFWSARVLILAGGLLTLVGGIVYAYGLANPEPDENLTFVTVTVEDTAAAWSSLTEIEGCVPDDATRLAGLPALLTTSDNDDRQQDGPFTFLVTEGACRGATGDVGEDQGSYEARSSTHAESDDAAADAEADAPIRVTVTIAGGSKVWREVHAACAKLDSAGDVTDLGATLVKPDADATDADFDGPFTIQLGDDRCPTADTIVVPDGDGSYRPVGS